MNESRPSLPGRLFGFLVRESIRDGAAQDFEDRRASIAAGRGRLIAGLWAASQILYLIPTFFRDHFIWSIDMLYHHLKTAVRVFSRSRGYSLINIFGLAAGMAGCLLILLWVRDETGFDRFHEDIDRLHRVVREQSRADHTDYSHTTPTALRRALKMETAEIPLASRFFFTGWSIQSGGKIFSPAGSMADPDFLNIFTFEFEKGNRDTALNDPLAIVIDDELAENLFGEENPMGRVLKIDNAVDCRVTGVFRKWPRNSYFDFEYILPMSVLEHRGFDTETWKPSPFMQTFVKIRPGSARESVDGKIAGLINRHTGSEDIRLFLQPVSDIHLHRLGGGGTIQSVRLFTAIAVFILLIAGFNFMNLSTARSSVRAREVGIRKVVGGTRAALIRQFFGESLLLTGLAFLIALAVTAALLPLFNQLSGKSLTSADLLQARFLILMPGIALLTGLVAGSYPAIFLSGFQPARTLKGGSPPGRGGGFRRSLVILQFSLSVLLIICTLVVTAQMRYIRNRPMGFDGELLITARMEKNSPEYEPVRQELLRDPRILNITATDGPPSYVGSEAGKVEWEGKAPDADIRMEIRSVHHEYFETFRMVMAAGRPFSEEFSTDSKEALVINQAAAAAMGMSEPVGRSIRIEERAYTVVGVVRDFHTRSLYEKIRPVLLRLSPEDCLYVCIRIAPEAVPATIERIAVQWQRLDPGYEFEYQFLDDRIDRLYRSERRMGRLLSVFTGLAILISCLGLLGLAAYMSERRRREIGIRKVLGSSTPAIVLLLSRSFVRWVLAANLIAWPAGYLIMRGWLSHFAYRVNMGALIFLASAGMSMTVAVLSVAWQAVRSARADPARTLRSP